MKRWISLLEIGVFYGLAHLIIWGSGAYRPPVLLVAVVMIGICFLSNKLHGDSIEKIGLSSNKFWPALKLVAPWFLLFVPLVWLGWGKNNIQGWGLWFAVLGYPIWGFAQEYVLLGFMANRWEDVLSENNVLIPWLNGFLFSMAHLPNPLLMTATMLSGVVFTRIFLKERHLGPPALAHALFGVGLLYAFGSIYGIMSVGPGYIARVGNTPLP